MKYLFLLFLFIGGAVVTPLAEAETLSSSNYQLVNPEIDTGGGTSNSANYRSEDVLDANPEDGRSNSANYRISSGFVPTAYPYVPGQPTFDNPTSASSFLHFVISQAGNSSDTNYAIAISSDNFTTTSYIQADNTVGVSPVFQTYTVWGGAAGQTVTGLTTNTTYKIKVKARYGPDSETAFSVPATAATVGVSLTFTISGVASGASVAAGTTNETTTASTVSFSSISADADRTAAQLLHVEGGGGSGYTVTAQSDADLHTSGSDTIASFGSALADNANSRGFGYSMQNVTNSDAAFVYSTNGFVFASKGFQTSPVTLMSKGSATATSEAYVIYRLRVGPLQATGNYSNQITYTAVTN
jgi:hypothetical protein